MQNTNPFEPPSNAAGHPQGSYPQGQTSYPQGQTGYPQGQTGYPQGQPGDPQSQPGYLQGQTGYQKSQPDVQGQTGYPPGQTGYQQSQPGGPQGQPSYQQGYSPALLSYSPAELKYSTGGEAKTCRPPSQMGYHGNSNSRETSVLVSPERLRDLGEDGNDGQHLAFTDQSIRRSFIRKVYGILMCQLLVTLFFIAIFLFNDANKKWVQNEGTALFWVSLVVAIGCLIAIVCCESMRRRSPTNYLVLGGFTLAMSFMIGMGCSKYDADSVMMAIGITAAICLALTLFAFQTKWDFTAMRGVFVACGTCFCVFSIIAFCAPNRIVGLVLAVFGALLYSFYLIYDTQLMMGGKHKYSISPEEYIFAALNLYIDIIMLFTYILRLVK